jgi:hypothetical protein
MMIMILGILLLLPVVVMATEGKCPVTSDMSSDGHLYVTNTAELSQNCQCFSEEVKMDLCTSAAAVVVNTTSDIGVRGDFECGGGCHGFVLNPNYVFWDATKNDWKEIPVCQDVSSLSTCDGMSQEIDCKVSYCANGRFKCQQAKDDTLCGGKVETTERLLECPSAITVSQGATAMNTLKYIFSHEGISNMKIHGTHDELYTAVTHYRTCTGHLKYTYDSSGDYCPPKVVSSFEEIEHYCMHGDISTFGDGRYKCDFDGQEDCSGTIDPVQVPTCEASNIASCQDKYYYEACTHEVGGTGTSNENNSEPNYIKFCSGGSFHCWDKRADQWCEGKVVPTFGSFESPVCPSVIPTCDSLEQFGINHQDCSCFHMNGLGGFVCGEWDNPYCKGDVDEGSDTENVEFQLIDVASFSSSSSGSEDSNSSQPAADENPDDGFDGNDVAFVRTDSVNSSPMKQSTTMIPLLVVSGLALMAVASFSWGYRRYRAKRKVEMRREDLAAALELTAHYRGDEDIDFIQHPRRLMIL